MRNFSSAEKLLFSISALLLVLSSYLLYDDSLLFSRGLHTNLQQVGSLTKLSNDVRRKTIEDFSWLPIRNQDVVYLKDSLFTGSSSSAILQLTDGTQLRISSNSLITLNMDGGELVLDLKFGDLSADLAANSKLSIKSGEDVSQVINSGQNNTTLELSKKPGASSVKVNTGELTLKSKNQGTSTRLNAQAPTVNLAGAAASKVVLTYSISEGTTFVAPTETSQAELSWSVKSGKAAKFKVEISRQPDFTEIISSLETQELKLLTNPLPTNQKYFWRVLSYDERGVNNNEAVPSFFSLSQLDVPTLVSPGMDQQLTVDVKQNKVKQGVSIPVTWKSEPNPQKLHQLQISRDENFQTILVDYKTALLTTTLQRVPQGQYYIRIRADIPSQKLQSVWSIPSAFSVVYNVIPEDEISPPVLLTEQINYSPQVTFDRRPASIDSPQISWRADYNYPSYKVQISTAASFNQILAEISTRNKVTRWENYQAGTYFVRVIGVMPDKSESAPSQTGKITVTLTSPQIADIPKEDKVAEIPGTKAPEHTFEVRWTQIPIASTYRVEVSQTEDFSTAESSITTENFYNYTAAAPGNFFFRVQPLDANQKPLTPPSSRAPAAYTFYAPPMPPSPLEPFDKTSIFLQQAIAPFIWLEWKTTEAFEYFEIEISSTEDFSKPLIKTQVKESRFLLKEKIPLGKVFWRVRSVSTNDSSFWSAPRSFSLISQKNETFVE